MKVYLVTARDPHETLVTGIKARFYCHTRATAKRHQRQIKAENPGYTVTVKPLKANKIPELFCIY